LSELYQPLGNIEIAIFITSQLFATIAGIKNMKQINEINQTESRKINLVPYIVLASVIFIAFVVVGFMIPSEITGDVMAELQETVSMLENLGPLSLLVVIFLNNAIKCLVVILLGIIIGLPSAIFICFNAATIGMLAVVLGPELGYNTVVLGLLPHGIIEIPVLVFSSALGLSVGAEAWKYILRQNSQVKKQMKYSLVLFTRWLIPALLVAAIIEVFITPLIISSAGLVPPI
jgi:stage II sporulation protein M